MHNEEGPDLFVAVLEVNLRNDWKVLLNYLFHNDFLLVALIILLELKQGVHLGIVGETVEDVKDFPDDDQIFNIRESGIRRIERNV